MDMMDRYDVKIYVYSDIDDHCLFFPVLIDIDHDPQFASIIRHPLPKIIKKIKIRFKIRSSEAPAVSVTGSTDIS